MPTPDEVKDKLSSIPVPGTMRNIVQMNRVRGIEIQEGKVSINLASAAMMPEVQEWLKAQILASIRNLESVKETEVSFSDMLPKDLNDVKYVIAVMSGKGGVGKSLVTSLSAIALARQGLAVGILDADITGPSIPRMFGITDRPGGSDSGMMPVTSKSGIEIMSINLLLPQEDDAVIWRGPLIGKAITQFWEEVLWGKLDYLFVDLPPGTADAPLSVMQNLPVTGVIIVFTPQELTAMIVKKAVKMANQMQKHVLGIVENMSYLYLPELKRNIEIFGKSRAHEMEAASGAPLLAQLPLDPELAMLCDQGKIEVYNGTQVKELGTKLLEAVAQNAKVTKTSA